MSSNYFLKKQVSLWSIKDAFIEIENNKPSIPVRHILHTLKNHLNDAAKVEDEERSNAAKKLLEDWRDIKNTLVHKRDKKHKKKYVKNINHGVSISNTHGDVHIYQDPNHAESSKEAAIGNLNVKRGRVLDDEENNSNWSWHSADKKRKTKYFDVYTSSCYKETDFGDMNDKSQQWIVNKFNMTTALREYRQVAEEGAQMRKHLSDARILALSFIFLFSQKERCIVSQLSPEHQLEVMKNLNVKQHLEFVEDEVLLACRKIQLLFYNEDMNDEEREDAIDHIKSCSQNKQTRSIAKIAKDIMPHLLDNGKFLNRQEGEANQIIELLRPFFLNCWTSQITGIKYEWLTYHLIPPPQHPQNQTMIPDFVLFVEPFSSSSFELCFVEVKRKGNYANGHNETDLVKLGKEMQIGINKLILQKVANPEVVGLLIEEDRVATAFKMDLTYNGQYRMVKLSEFSFIGKTSVDDILLLPTIVEKLNQLKAIIKKTLTNLYKSIEDNDDQEDLTGYIRVPCMGPVRTKQT